MPRLENVVNAMQKREPNADDLLKYATQQTLQSMMNKLNSPYVTPDEFKDAVQGLGSGMKSLARMLKKVESNVNGEVSKRPTNFDSVLEAISTLEKNIKSLTGAISSIKLPDVNIPPFPEYKETDLRPILDEVWDTKRILQNLKIEAPAPVIEQKGRSFTFDIKRNQAGYIKSIDCKECYE